MLFLIPHSAFLKQKEALRRMLLNNSYSCDAKLLMFSAATISEGYQRTLLPMPPLFMSRTYYTIQELRDIVTAWPNCTQLREQLYTSDRDNHIQLLHWILIDQANPILRRVNVHQLRGVCREYHLHRPTFYPKDVFSITYKDELQRASTSEKRFAYLGCPLHLLYRLLTLGRMDNNWAGPLRLYAQPEPALAQCTTSMHPTLALGWTHSIYGRAPRCVLICELLQEELIHRQRQQAEIVIYDTSLIRVHFILVYTEYTRLSRAALTSFSGTQGDIFPVITNQFSSGFGASKTGCLVMRGFGSIASWLHKRITHLIPRQNSRF